MIIQLLNHSGSECCLKGKNILVKRFHDAQSFDEFDINIIDLRDNGIWRNYYNATSAIDILKDFESLSIIIGSRNQSQVVILLPQNLTFYYSKKYNGGYDHACELKDMISSLKNILKSLYAPINTINIIYENTKTVIDTEEVVASFHFGQNQENILTNSVKSNKATTIKCNNIILSVLDIKYHEQLIGFLKQIHLINEKQEIPEWIRGENMFDDKKQLEIIEENNNHIKEAQYNIDEAMKIIRRNEKYKSILYTSGDELVSVVFEILQDMLGCNLSSFVDDKKEDFHFELNDKIFIGEIKGITSNVKSQNVSQLDVHVQGYLDVHEDKTQDNIVALLIIDHQRNKPLNEREEVHDIQVSLAKRNNSLIIETITLLRMFEKYLNGSFSRDKCIELLIENNGKLEI